MMETFPAAGPVKTSIIGKETPECIEAAQRVQENMNYQLNGHVCLSIDLNMKECYGVLG
jgi:hypothetical protein